jgi:hypothetical protein
MNLKSVIILIFVSIPGMERFFSSQHPDRLWGPPNLLSNGYLGRFPQDHSPPSSAEIKNGGTIHPLPHTSSWRYLHSVMFHGYENTVLKVMNIFCGHSKCGSGWDKPPEMAYRNNWVSTLFGMRWVRNGQ